MRKNKSVKYLLVTKLPLSLLKSHQKFNDSKILGRQWLPPVSVQIAMYKNNPKRSSIKQHITLGWLGGSSAVSTPHLLGYLCVDFELVGLFRIGRSYNERMVTYLPHCGLNIFLHTWSLIIEEPRPSIM